MKLCTRICRTWIKEAPSGCAAERGFSDPKKGKTGEKVVGNGHLPEWIGPIKFQSVLICHELHH